MRLHRIVGFAWFYGGVVASTFILIQAIGDVKNSVNFFTGAMTSYLICFVLTSCLVAIGWSLVKSRPWAKWPGYILATIIALYSLSFILMVGAEFGWPSWIFSVFIFLFSICSIVFIKKSVI